MDQGRFDSLARSLATAKTRRGLLGSLAALGTGLLGARATDAQVTQAQCGNVLCASNPGVCTGVRLLRLPQRQLPLPPAPGLHRSGHRRDHHHDGGADHHDDYHDGGAHNDHHHHGRPDVCRD